MSLTRAALISLESPFGNGVYTARAMQLAKIVNKIKYSNGVNIWLRKILIFAEIKCLLYMYNHFPHYDFDIFKQLFIISNQHLFLQIKIYLY